MVRSNNKNSEPWLYTMSELGYNYRLSDINCALGISQLKRIELFIKNYFFNTVFLLNEEQYNSLTRETKVKLGYDCPFQFAVINGLTPTKEEMELQKIIPVLTF